MALTEKEIQEIREEAEKYFPVVEKDYRDIQTESGFIKVDINKSYRKIVIQILTKEREKTKELIKKLSASQIEAIEWIGENGRFFHSFNCYLKRQTVKSLERMGIIQKCKDNPRYMELTDLGKTFFAKTSLDNYQKHQQ